MVNSLSFISKVVDSLTVFSLVLLFQVPQKALYLLAVDDQLFTIQQDPHHPPRLCTAACQIPTVTAQVSLPAPYNYKTYNAC